MCDTVDLLDLLARRPFSKLDASAEGTGLGLASVSTQSAILGGSCGVSDSAKLGGACFFFEVPYVEAEAACPTEHVELIHLTPQRRTASLPPVEAKAPLRLAWAAAVAPSWLRDVLVIEDDKLIREAFGRKNIQISHTVHITMVFSFTRIFTMPIREVFESMLMASGYRVHLAYDGHNGLQMLKQQRYLAVFTDIMMSVMDGHACVTAFRTWEAEESSGRCGGGDASRQFITGMSATLSVHEEEKAKRAGMDDFLGKPVNRQNMLRLLQRLADAACG